ncbi:MAG: cell division protein FtsK, partial [Oscillospiraceae bacterium]|nr:cell division protein FtsK [Oscillospiraceae bacterium]
VCAQYGRLSPQRWARNFSHQDLLYHRLGIGSLPFQVPIVVPKRRFTMIEDDLADRPQKIHDDFQTLYQVPVGVDLMERRLWGILGNWKSRCAVARLLITQIAANNCYTDVKLAFLLDGRNRRNQEMWGFVRWLPHVWSEDGNIRYFAMNRSERGEVAYALNNVLRLRSEQKDNFQKQVYRPQYIVFVEREDLLEGESIAKYLLNSDTDLGVTTILLAEHPEDLPNSCVNLIQNDGQFQGFYYVEEGEESRRPLTFDHISLEDAEALSRRLASVKVSELERGGEIPDQLTFFEMMKCQSLEEMRVLDRWRKNRTYESMRALIGQKAGGLDCYLDIHEKYHGPHGLLAGTTGSGKSETLQTYILSLAVNFSPNDICFFIIDYKGGGMGNLFSGLPHVAGQISNLSGNQVYRAMVSIKSENRRRQRIFSEHGVNHIDQYTQLIKQNEATQPIPHLFIIIDEFAELKKEESDFMRELISVAQVGRSLGVHLILATQKPNGTVDENISSNAKFRLCLRVQNRQDSNEMLHKPDAAYITQAGRGYLQVGSDEIYEQFQSGWSGADYDEDATRNSGDLASMRTNTGRSAIVGNYAKKQQKEAQRRAWISALVRMVRTASQEEHSPESLLDALYALLEADSWNYTRSKSNDSRLLEFVQLCRKLDKPEQGAEDTAKLILETGDRLPECKSKTQLAAVVEYLGKVARENHYENSNPLWLPVLPDKLFWQSVVRAETVFQNGAWPGHTGPWDLRAVVGLSDDPANQQQEPLEISFSGGGHLALCGAVVSGKSTFLQTLVFDLIHRYSPQEVQFYMLDLSGSLLAPFAQAPHVGGILNEDEIGDVTKLFVMLEQLLAERKALLKGGSFSQYVREHSLPAVFLIIDNYANFREKTENRFENLLFTLSREGLSYGLFLVVSSGGFGISEVPSRMAGNFRNTVCLEMGDRFKYADVLHTIHIDVLPEANVKGRGLAPVGGNILEFQTALAMEAEDDYKRAEAIEAVCQQMANAWKGPKAAPIPSIPERPVWADLERWADMASIQSQPQLLPFAYYRRDASIASINLQNTYCWLISGGPRTGKTNLLRILLRSAKAKGGDTCVFELSGQRNLEMDCTRYQSEYVSDVQEVTEYFKKLTVIFQERNKKKHELEDQGASDEEIFAEMSKLPPVFLLIDSLEDFVHTLYNTPRDVSSCSALLETLTERGRLHNIYFFVCMDPLNSKVVGKKVYTNIVGYKTGIHLGGNVTTVLKHLNFRSVPFTEQEKPMKPGLGLLPPDALDPSVREVVIPKAVGEAKA